VKISYNLRWHPSSGTAYRQTVRITEEENKQLFGGLFKPGANYGNADTGGHIAAAIWNKPEYAQQLKRLIIHNTIVFVGAGVIPVH
jgi:hypothetical protein